MRFWLIMTLSAADFCQTSQRPGVHCPTLFWPRCPQNQLFKTSVFCFSESENMIAIATDIFLLSSTSQDHCVMSKHT